MICPVKYRTATIAKCSIPGCTGLSLPTGNILADRGVRYRSRLYLHFLRGKGLPVQDWLQAPADANL